MFGLMDSLDDGAWEEKDEAKKTGEYKEYHVLHSHKRIDDTTIAYMVAEEDGDPKSVEIFGCKKNKDPLKDIGALKLKIDEGAKKIIGIDLEGDVVEVKR